jgi:hypothetical protein
MAYESKEHDRYMNYTSYIFNVYLHILINNAICQTEKTLEYLLVIEISEKWIHFLWDSSNIRRFRGSSRGEAPDAPVIKIYIYIYIYIYPQIFFSVCELRTSLAIYICLQMNET